MGVTLLVFINGYFAYLDSFSDNSVYDSHASYVNKAVVLCGRMSYTCFRHNYLLVLVFIYKRPLQL